jgi:DNA-binding NtrC family response regulator
MKQKLKIAVVDDERIVRVTISDDLRDAGHNVREYADGGAVLASMGEFQPDIVITDLKMPGMDGIQLMKKAKEVNPEIAMVMMTAHGTIENAVEAMKLGAYDYITKPFKPDEMLLIISRISELTSMKNENKRLRTQIKQNYDFSSYVGDEETNKQLFDLIKLVAPTDSTILITGETGTGKELLTNIIHFNSNRSKQPLIKVSCAILSKDLFESELFGHVKGAFTGADSDKQGRFELAHGGTLYLDDIDDIPLELQVKLLRALEQREIERVGSAKTISVDVRLIASTKRDLRSMVAEGKFREDLFYRINVFPLNLPPLRERKKDIKTLADFYVNKFSQNRNLVITEEAYNILLNYHWPGNIRELKNISERLALLATDGIINEGKMPLEIRQPRYIDVYANVGSKSLEQTLNEIEIASIRSALEKCNNNKSKAAELLGLPVSTLRTKIDKHGIGFE